MHKLWNNKTSVSPDQWGKYRLAVFVELRLNGLRATTADASCDSTWNSILFVNKWSWTSSSVSRLILSYRSYLVAFKSTSVSSRRTTHGTSLRDGSVMTSSQLVKSHSLCRWNNKRYCVCLAGLSRSHLADCWESETGFGFESHPSQR